MVVYVSRMLLRTLSGSVKISPPLASSSTLTADGPARTGGSFPSAASTPSAAAYETASGELGGDSGGSQQRRATGGGGINAMGCAVLNGGGIAVDCLLQPAYEVSIDSVCFERLRLPTSWYQLDLPLDWIYRLGPAGWNCGQAADSCARARRPPLAGPPAQGPSVAAAPSRREYQPPDAALALALIGT